jgi:exopolysaccharide biosynthesis polyprenyl glycosylphosphotransferase
MVMAEFGGAGRPRVGLTEYVDGTLGGDLLSGRRSAANASLGRGAAARQNKRGPRGRRSSWNRDYRRRAIIADFVVATATGATSATLAMPDATVLARVEVAAATPVLWLGMLSLVHGYERRFAGSGPEEYRAVTRSAFYLVGAVAVVSYLLPVEVPRVISAVSFTMLFVLGLVARRVVRSDLYRRRSEGRERQETVIIGNLRSVQAMIREIKRAPEQGLHVVAACVSGLDLQGDRSSQVEGIPVFGYPEEAMSAVDLFAADVVAVSSDPDLDGPELRRLAWSLEERDVELVVSPGLLGVAGPRLSIRPTAGMPLLHVERPVMSGARRIVKTVVDKSLTLLLLVVALPVLVAIAVAIHLDSPGPVLFRQTRVGARGEEFAMLKFRTMCLDAEERLACLQRDAGNAVMFKMKDDPRVTRVGRLLRRFSLDELPQLANVLKGEMSLVGPRPPLLREVQGYEPDAVRRLRVRPGLTGLWQVSGRSDLTWDESLRLDLWYVDNWCLALDLQILVRTARAVVRGSGAY